jgi:autotransporter-associated beta strand protein
MPDAWESANGTNPNSADATVAAANGYLNIENYINSITSDDSQFYLRAPLLPKSAGKTASSISVEWRDYTHGEDGFEVSYSLNGSSGWTVAGTTAANATSYTISGLGSGAYHWVRIRAFATRSGTKVYGPYSKTAKLYTSASSAAEVDLATFAPDVTYKRVVNSQPWNKTDSQYWAEGIPYQDGYKVLINQNSSGSGMSLNVDETISPGAVVVNGTGTITLNGNGNLSGAACSINKGNTGHLFLYGENTYEGPVVNHGGTISFNKIANGGVASGLGKSQSFADNWIFDGGTYRFTGGTASTDRDALLRSASALEVKDKVLTMNGVFEGEGDFILQGSGTLDVPNGSFFGYTGATILRGGTLKLSDANASTGSAMNFHPTQLVMAGGSLFIASDSGYQQDQNMTLDIEVADNTTSSITIPGRGIFSGTISNASDDAGDDDEDEDGGANDDETYVYNGSEGSLRIYVPYSRGYIANDFSQFHGTIIANCTHKDGRFMKNGSWNAPTTRFYLERSSVSGATTYMSAYPANTTNKLGGLSGDSGTYLIGCSSGTSSTPCNWIVGSADTDETFNGEINNLTWDLKHSANVSITKVGTGYWRLNGNTEHRSGTTVNEGTLIMNATHTQSGVTVNSGAMLRGKGTIKTAITVNSGATLYPGDEAESSSMTADSSVTLKGGSTMKVGNAALWANGTVYINSGVTLAVDTSVKTLAAGTKIQVFKGAFNFSGTFSSIEPATPGENLEWDISSLYTDGQIKVKSNVPIKTYFIGGDGAYWDQTTSWDNGIPTEDVTAIFTNDTKITVNLGWGDWSNDNPSKRVCGTLQLDGADVVFQANMYWPRLSPKKVTGRGTMYLPASNNRDNSYTTAVGLVTQSDSDMFVEVPVVVESNATKRDQDVFFEGLNGHTINFYRPVTIAPSGHLIAYDGTHFRGGFAVESTKWNSIRGTNTIACNLTGAGNLYLEVDAGITYFTGDNSGFTGTINQELYSNVPRFIGGASAPVNGTVNIKGDMFIIPSEYGETFRFGALNLTRGTWYFCYVMKNMGVKIEVGSKGDSFWEDGYYFGTWDGTTASTAETTDAEIIKVGAGTTLAAYAQQYDNTKISTKDGICIHPRWSQDFENAETYAAQFSGGTVASTAFGTSESSYNLKGTVTQAERTIYGTEATSKFFRGYIEKRNDVTGAIFSLPQKVSSATEGYRVEFDYYLSQNIVSSDNDSTADCSGLVVSGSGGTMMTILGRAGKDGAERANAGAFKGDSLSDDDKITTVRSWGRGTDPASDSAQAYWNHYTIIGVPSGARKGVYLSITRINGDATDNVTSYKLSDDYSTVQAINLISAEYNNAYRRYICLDNVVASIAETGKPYIANDDGATLSGDEDTGWTLTPSAGASDIVVYIPTGVAPASVTVRAPVDSATVTPNGANVRVVRGESDITDYLDIPAAVDGVVSIAGATVKDEFVKEPLDTEKGAVIELSSESVRLVTAPTRAGLLYQLKEGETLGEMFDCEEGDSKIGDGSAWEPEITVRGGQSGFYSVSVGK